MKIRFLIPVRPIIVIVILLFAGCNGNRSTAVKTDSSRVVTVITDTAPRETILGYSYFRKIATGSSKSVNVFISTEFGKSRLVDTLRTVTLDETFRDQYDTPTIGIENFSENFDTYDSVDVTLTDPSRSFHIDTIGASRQPVLVTSRWEWVVTPVTDQSKASLVINAVPRRRDGSTKFIQPKTIYIQIEITPAFFRKLWIFINGNPWKFILAIVIPLISFFGARYYRSRDAKKKSGSV